MLLLYIRVGARLRHAELLSICIYVLILLNMRTHMSSYYCRYIYVLTILHTSKSTTPTMAPGLPSASYTAIAYYYVLLYTTIYYYIFVLILLYILYIRVGGRLWHAQLPSASCCAREGQGQQGVCLHCFYDCKCIRL